VGRAAGVGIFDKRRSTNCAATRIFPRAVSIYVLKAKETDTRPAVSALANLVQEMATAISTDAVAPLGRLSTRR